MVSLSDIKRFSLSKRFLSLFLVIFVKKNIWVLSCITDKTLEKLASSGFHSFFNKNN